MCVLFQVDTDVTKSFKSSKPGGGHGAVDLGEEGGVRRVDLVDAIDGCVTALVPTR